MAEKIPKIWLLPYLSNLTSLLSGPKTHQALSLLRSLCISSSLSREKNFPRLLGFSHPSVLNLYVNVSEKASSLKSPQLGLHVILYQNILFLSFLALAKTYNSFYLPTYLLSTSLTRKSIPSSRKLCLRRSLRYLQLHLERIPSSTPATPGTSCAFSHGCGSEQKHPNPSPPE